VIYQFRSELGIGFLYSVLLYPVQYSSHITHSCHLETKYCEPSVEHAPILQDQLSNRKRSSSTEIERHPSSKPHCNGRYIPKQNGPKHAPAAKALKKSNKRLCSVKVLRISSPKPDSEWFFPAYLHLPANYRREAAERHDKTAVILMSGASGGVAGPSSIYISMADKIASLRRGIPVLRMDYRYPARSKYCVADVLAAMDFLQRALGIGRFVLVGWSFGGAPVMAVGGQDDRVVGCATIASQSAETEGIERIAAKSLPLLLLHGTGDRTETASCSERLLERYQQHAKDDMGFLHLFDDDDHALTKNSSKAEAMLCAFVMRCAGVEITESEDSVVLRTSLVAEEERVKLMEEAGDLGEGESLR
jgi:dienelactone hydrolase